MQYPHSNIRLVKERLNHLLSAEDVKTMMARFMQADPEDYGFVTETNFRSGPAFLVSKNTTNSAEFSSQKFSEKRQSLKLIVFFEFKE